MKQDSLFELPASAIRPSRRALLSAYKKANGIRTHYFAAADDEAKWLAVAVPPKRLDNGGPIEGMHLEDMMNAFCRLLDDAGRTGYGPTERDAIEDLGTRHKLPPL